MITKLKEAAQLLVAIAALASGVTYGMIKLADLETAAAATEAHTQLRKAVIDVALEHDAQSERLVDERLRSMEKMLLQIDAKSDMLLRASLRRKE